MAYSDRYMAYMGMGPKRIPHWEHWSCPDAETHQWVGQRKAQPDTDHTRQHAQGSKAIHLRVPTIRHQRG